MSSSSMRSTDWEVIPGAVWVMAGAGAAREGAFVEGSQEDEPRCGLWRTESTQTTAPARIARPSNTSGVVMRPSSGLFRVRAFALELQSCLRSRRTMEFLHVQAPDRLPDAAV